MNHNVLSLLCCPYCHSDLEKRSAFLHCPSCYKKYPILGKNIFSVNPDLTFDIELSIKKWDQFYQKQLPNNFYLQEEQNYLKKYFNDEYCQLNQAKKIKPNLVYLEIGCGPMFLGQQLASKVELVIGIDFSLQALKIAQKMLETKNIKNYLLIQGDILNLPLKSNLVDLIHGGGVIEHFRNTEKCLSELYRVLRPQGVSFQAVPALNLGALTYRQIWGNIPNFPILKQLFEFIHLKMMRGKYMRFGYELSFLGSTLKKIGAKVGFRHLHVAKLEVATDFNYLPTKTLKSCARYLANHNSLFWPMLKFIAQK